MPDVLAKPTAKEGPSNILKAIRLLNLLHSEVLSVVDQGLLRQALLLLWQELDPENGGEAKARVW